MSFSIQKIVGTSGFKEEICSKNIVFYGDVSKKKFSKLLDTLTLKRAENFVDNKIEIQKKFCTGTSIKRITDIKSGLSDVHNQGKSVVVVTLDDSLELLYKPRSMENDRVFLNLLKWISDKVGLDCYQYPILSYENDSWGAVS